MTTLSKHLVGASAEDVPDILRANLREGRELDLLSAASWLLAIHTADRTEYLTYMVRNPEDAAGAALRAFATLLPRGDDLTQVLEGLDRRVDYLPDWVDYLNNISVTGQLYHLVREDKLREIYVCGLKLIDGPFHTITVAREPADGPITEVLHFDKSANLVADSYTGDPDLEDAYRLKRSQLGAALNDAVARTIGVGQQTPTWPIHSDLTMWLLRLVNGEER